MSAAELLKQVETLSIRERRKFLKAVQALDDDAPLPLATKKKPVKWPDVEARAKRLFGNRVLPNLILLEREEQPF